MSLFSKEKIEGYFNTEYYDSLDMKTRLEGEQIGEEATQAYQQKVAASKPSGMSTKSTVIILTIAGTALIAIAILKKKGIF